MLKTAGMIPTVFGQDIEQLRAENEKLKSRCFPSKIVMIDDAGHYVSEGVFSHIECLKAELAEAKKDASRWFSLVMNAAAELEDAANCLHDSDAKKNAQSAAKYYRGEAMKGK